MPQKRLQEPRIIEAGEFGRSKWGPHGRHRPLLPGFVSIGTLRALNIDRVSSIKAGRSLYARSAPIGPLQGGHAANPGRVLARRTIASPRFFSQTRNRTSPRDRKSVV